MKLAAPHSWNLSTAEARDLQTSLACRVDVLEQLVAGQALAALDDARQATVTDVDRAHLSALAAELEAQARALDVHVVVTQRRQAERSVLARILFVADSD